MRLIIISFIALIALGLSEGMLGVAWPGIKRYFGLPIDALGIIIVFGTCGYMLSSFLNGMLIRIFGIGGLLSLSCAISAFSLLIYAKTDEWSIFLIFAMIGGFGAGGIDASINTYIAKCCSGRMMQWLHAGFGVGITLGPVIMTLGISLTSYWESGYLLVSALIIFLSFIFFMTKNMWVDFSAKNTKYYQPKSEASILVTLKSRPTQLSMLTFFLYGGVELCLGFWAYSLLTESRGVSQTVAGLITSSYWGMFTAGRIIAGLYAKKINDWKLIYSSIFLALLGIGLLITNSGEVISIMGIGITGFAIAPIFPGLVSNTERRVGQIHHTNAIGLQMAASAFGIAIIPSFAGILAKIYSLEVIPLYLLSAILLMFLVFAFLHFESRKIVKAYQKN